MFNFGLVCFFLSFLVVLFLFCNEFLLGFLLIKLLFFNIVCLGIDWWLVVLWFFFCSLLFIGEMLCFLCWLLYFFGLWLRFLVVKLLLMLGVKFKLLLFFSLFGIKFVMVFWVFFDLYIGLLGWFVELFLICDLVLFNGGFWVEFLNSVEGGWFVG